MHYNVKGMDSHTSKQDKQKMVNEFNDPTSRMDVLLTTYRIGSQGMFVAILELAFPLTVNSTQSADLLLLCCALRTCCEHENRNPGVGTCSQTWSKEASDSLQVVR
jgi:hypothetical protein